MHADSQRCWVHKTANVLNKVPLSVQANMKTDLREIYGAPTRAAAEMAIEVFVEKYGPGIFGALRSALRIGPVARLKLR